MHTGIQTSIIVICWIFNSYNRPNLHCTDDYARICICAVVIVLHSIKKLEFELRSISRPSD